MKDFFHQAPPGKNRRMLHDWPNGREERLDDRLQLPALVVVERVEERPVLQVLKRW